MAGSARTAEKGASTRLSADDWLLAALDIMVAEGIAGVKIHRLCERLGVTKGSFYWHFQDLDAFLAELARRWGEEGERVPAQVVGSSDPGAGLLHAMELFADKRNRNLTRAMRDWAQTDERAREAIRKTDEAAFQVVRDAIVSLGYDDAEAEVRAKVLYYAGVGFAHVGPLGSRQSAQQQITATWDLLTQH
jgi:AcrR family transcriptional regulator